MHRSATCHQVGRPCNPANAPTRCIEDLQTAHKPRIFALASRHGSQDTFPADPTFRVRSRIPSTSPKRRCVAPLKRVVSYLPATMSLTDTSVHVRGCASLSHFIENRNAIEFDAKAPDYVEFFLGQDMPCRVVRGVDDDALGIRCECCPQRRFINRKRRFLQSHNFRSRTSQSNTREIPREKLKLCAPIAPN